MRSQIVFKALLALPLIMTSMSAADTNRPPIVGVAHIALQTNNVEGAKQFYGHALGLSDLAATKPEAGAPLMFFKVNDHQYIQVMPGLQSDEQDRLVHIAFETTDAKKLRSYLASRKVTVPDHLEKDSEGNLSFHIRDAENHEVEFVQYLRGSAQSRQFGKLLNDERVSKRVIHVGFIVHDRAAADALFRDVLGFQLMWYGGRTEERVDYVDMRVPDGSDWLEYMLNVSNPTPRTRGVMNHLALGVPEIQAAFHAITERGLVPPQAPKLGVDGKWQLNLYDPNLTRTELMEFRPVGKPCCSPMLLPAKILTQ